MPARVDRSVAGREVVSATERLMDGMLAQEEKCFRLMQDALGDLATAAWRRVEARARSAGRVGVEATILDLLPAVDQLVGVVMPPIGDLLALARERTLVVVRRQLRACESAISSEWSGMARRAVRAAEPETNALERVWYERALAAATRSSVVVREEMGNQAGIWASRKEQFPELRARWYSEDLVRLPGSSARGTLWDLRVSMNAEARNASVALTNGLILAGMQGWNQVAKSAAV
jgi:hypothetical protein